MPPGDPNTRRGVTLTVPIRAHVPHALFYPRPAGLRVRGPGAKPVFLLPVSHGKAPAA